MSDSAFDNLKGHRLDAIKALWERGEIARAESLLREFSAHEPAREDVAMLLASVLRSHGSLSAASGTLLALCNANRFDPDLSLRCAEFVRQCDRHVVAARICTGALARGSGSPDLLMLAANVARESGDFATARAHYLAALDSGINLERNHVLGALVNTRRYTDPADPDIAFCERHFRDASFSPRSRASAGFALAKTRDDLADYAAAAGTLRAANAMVHARQPWSSATWRSFVEARRFDKVIPVRSMADADFAPVFVVGVPRTGTTLTATSLARVTGARDRGELRALRYIAEQLVSGSHLGSQAALTEARNLYRTLAVQDDAPATCYLDQDPLNFRWLHIAAAMFPQARVIHLRRDRRDTALSLWCQDFAHPDLAFAYDFDDMTAFMAGHDTLMRHWKESLPLPILEVDYESLVGEPHATLAKLSGFIGMTVTPPDARDDPAPVQSASVWQARQPIYSTSVGRWRHYAPYVPELDRFGQAA